MAGVGKGMRKPLKTDIESIVKYIRLTKNLRIVSIMILFLINSRGVMNFIASIIGVRVVLIIIAYKFVPLKKYADIGIRPKVNIIHTVSMFLTNFGLIHNNLLVSGCLNRANNIVDETDITNAGLYARSGFSSKKIPITAVKTSGKYRKPYRRRYTSQHMYSTTAFRFVM